MAPHIKHSINPISFLYNVKEYTDWCGAPTVYNSAGLWSLSGTPANQAEHIDMYFHPAKNTTMHLIPRNIHKTKQLFSIVPNPKPFY
jgi:hypothetical protein